MFKSTEKIFSVATHKKTLKLIFHNKTIEAVQLNLNLKLIKYNQLKKNQSDPPGSDNTEKAELQLDQIHCEATDVESETKNKLLRNMLHNENENETRIEANY